MTANARQEPTENLEMEYNENIAELSSLQQERQESVQPTKAGLTRAGRGMTPILNPRGPAGK